MAEGEDFVLPVSEFQQWFETNHSDGGDVVMFLTEHRLLKNGAVRMDFSFSDDGSEFTIVCPDEYPNCLDGLFDVRSTCERLTGWLQKMRSFATENRGQIKMPALLSKAVEYYRNDSGNVSSVQLDSDFEEEQQTADDDVARESLSDSDEHEGLDLVCADDNFTTHWDIQMDMLKKRWLAKEKEQRDSEVKCDSEASTSPSGLSKATESSWGGYLGPGITGKHDEDDSDDEIRECYDPWDTTLIPKISAKKSKSDEFVKAGQQIFQHENAAFQVLLNEMVSLLKKSKEEVAEKSCCEFSCDTVDDNLYRWAVQIGDFPADHPLSEDLARLKEKYGYNTIQLQLAFVRDFPFYPPLLRLVRPRFKGSLVQSLANIDILKLTYWNPAKTVHEVLKQIKGILIKHARLDLHTDRNDPEKHQGGAYLLIEDYLIKLALAAEVRPRANFEIINIDSLEKAPQLKKKEVQLPTRQQKRAGIGYGSGSMSSGWNPESYVKAQKEKDKQILDILSNVKTELEAIDRHPSDRSDVYSVIEGSSLLPFLEQQLSVGSFIEIDRHLGLYELILDVVNALSDVEYLLPLLCNLPCQKFCLMTLLQNLRDSAMQYLSCTKQRETSAKSTKQSYIAKAAMKFKCVNDEDDQKETQELSNAKKIIDLFARLKAKLSAAGLTYSNDEQHIDNQPKASFDSETLEQRYVRLLKPLQFANFTVDLTSLAPHKFSKHTSDKMSKEIRTIFKEWTALRSSLPLNLKSSVFVRVDEDQMNLLEALIVGPEDTPYANGCFLFDICFPLTYPNVPPLVNLRTTGGGRVRFNPNLYQCGKVCLSLLGTWSGERGESWNSRTSTLLQVLVSIQSLIMVEEPYFNEPGYERSMGSEEGQKASERYNKDVRSNCLQYAMLEQLTEPPTGFESVVRLHYQIKKDSVLAQLESWQELDPDNSVLRANVDKMKKELQKLPQ